MSQKLLAIHLLLLDVLILEMWCHCNAVRVMMAVLLGRASLDVQLIVRSLKMMVMWVGFYAEIEQECLLEQQLLL